MDLNKNPHDYINKVDILTDSSLTFSHNIKKTKLGAIMSVVIIVLFILLNYKSTISFFTNKNPSMTLESRTFDSPTVFNFKENSLYFAFSVFENNGSDFRWHPVSNYDSFHYFEASYHTVNENEHNIIRLEIKPCKDFQFTHKSNEYEEYKDYYVCVSSPELNMTRVSHNEFNFLQISLKNCIPGTINPNTNKICDVFIRNKFYLNYLIPNYNIIRDNTNKGFEEILEFNTLGFISDYYILNRVYISKAIMETNIGKILDYNKVEESIFASKEFRDVTYYPMTDTAIDILIYPSNDYKLYSRSFMKVDQLLGQFGGIFQIVLVLVSFINSIYSNNLFYLNLLRNASKWQFPKFENIKRIGRKSNKLPSNIGRKLEDNRKSIQHLIDDKNCIYKNIYASNDNINKNKNKNKDIILNDNNKILSLNNPNIINCEVIPPNKECNFVSEDVKDSEIEFDNKMKMSINVVDIKYKINKYLEPSKINSIKIDRNNLEKADSVNLNLNNDGNNSFSSDIENINNYDCAYYSNLNTRLINIKSELSKNNNSKSCSTPTNYECSFISLIFYKIFTSINCIKGTCLYNESKAKLQNNIENLKNEVDKKLEIENYFRSLLLLEILSYLVLDKSQKEDLECLL